MTKHTEFKIHSPKYGDYIVHIDYEDFKKIKDYTWSVHFTHSGRLAHVFTNITIGTKRTKLLLHKLIVPFEIVDHIDGNPLNNKKDNLRPCTRKENGRNRNINKNNSSGFKGVSFITKKNRMCAQIKVDYKNIHLGYFKTAEEAARAYNAAALKYHGKFARLNKIK